jgi:diguanylate cyclase (GGDEF)-like protein
VDVAAVTSSVALTAHLVCVLLLALTFSYLSILFPWIYLRHWSVAWWSLLVGIGAVRASLTWPEMGIGFWVLFLSAEWVFLFYLLAGSRELALGHPVTLQRFLPALPGSILLATMIVPFFTSFDQLFAVESLLMCSGFALSLWALRTVIPVHRTVGLRMMQVALVFLFLLHLSYIPLFWFHPRPILPWLSYTPLADLFAELLLGFGMVFVVSEEARRELTDALVEVRRARDLIERQARLDPLTETLNRHAFQSILKGEGIDPSVRRGHGTVIMVDLDHLKAINDREGHPVGDAAIQAAAKAIRGLIRVEDFLFRWGGDEFLVLTPGLNADRAAERFQTLEGGVFFRGRPEAPEMRLRLSWGIAEFGGRTSIQEAIALADAAMYERRATRRTARSRSDLMTPIPAPTSAPTSD